MMMKLLKSEQIIRGVWKRYGFCCLRHWATPVDRPKNGLSMSNIGNLKDSSGMT